MSAKEKQLVVDDRSANRAAKLVPLQPVVLKRKGIARVQRSLAQKLKRIAMKVIRAGLRYRVDRARGVDAVLRLQSTCFHLELLQ